MNYHMGWGRLVVAVSVFVFLYILMTLNCNISGITGIITGPRKRSFGNRNRDVTAKHEDVTRAFQEESYTIRRFFETKRRNLISDEIRSDSNLSHSNIKYRAPPDSGLNVITSHATKSTRVENTRTGRSTNMTEKRVGGTQKSRIPNTNYTRKNSFEGVRGAGRDTTRDKRANDTQGSSMENADINDNMTRKTAPGEAVGKFVDNHNTRASHNPTTRVPRVNVMLIAYYRSGSSFMGEMFNRNPNAFYLFEPVHVLEAFFEKKYSPPLLQNTLVRHLLDTVYSCAFEKHPLYSHTISTSAFRLKSEALSSSYCDPRASPSKMHLCKALNATTVSRICRARPLVVVKTIRMKNWKNFQFLANQQTPFKAIHLVRDPRAVVASRVLWLLQRMPRGKERRAKAVRKAFVRYVSIHSTLLCNQMENDMRNFEIETRHFIAMIRYEDAAERPLTAYKEIYKFVGTGAPEEVRQWLLSNTNVDMSANYFSTTRKSSAAARSWRHRMPMVLVAAVQEKCRNVLDSLKYKLVENEDELQNMSQSLVMPWSNGKLVQTK